MITKIKIKSRTTCAVIFEHECEDNSIRKTVEEAVRNGNTLHGANLYGANLEEANLAGADLSYADLRCADLNCANFNGANLNGANLYSANLDGAHLRGAILDGATLTHANLYGVYLDDAILCDANFNGANLSYADLRGADIRGANLYRADLNMAVNVPYIPLACPSDGAFTGWKRVYDCIIELEIPADARRSSATTRKCRCDKAKVISIKDEEGNDIEEIVSEFCPHTTTYRVGEMVYPDSFDEDRWHECSYGIHFFINKQDAINY